MVTKREALLERARRKQAAERAVVVVKGIRRELYRLQQDIIDDLSMNIAVLGTRRAGKTETWPRAAVIMALLHPGAIIRIWAASRLRCKELIWQKTIDVCNRHLPEEMESGAIKTHETELRFTFPNRSEIRLVGADKDKEAQKKRGDKTVLEIVLEAQSFGTFLETLVEDVVEPSLFDARSTRGSDDIPLMGAIILEGTPGPVCTGYWYWITGDDGSETQRRWFSKGRKLKFDDEREVTKGANWSCHRLHVLTNPFLPDAKVELARTIQRKGWDANNPTYQREWRAIWVTDNDALYYKWQLARNGYTLDEIKPWGPGWTHVLGWDVGFNDANALVVWGWHEHSNVLYECASWQENHTTSGPVVEKIREFQERFNIVRMVADTGGGAKVFVEEVQSRHSLVFVPAQKQDKFAHVTLMNDDFISKRIKTLIGSDLSRDLGGLIKDRDWDPTSGKPPESDPSAHEFSHTTDAALYAWRYAYSFLATERPKERPALGTPEAAKLEEKEYDERMAQSPKKGEWWECEPGAEEAMEDSW